MSRPEGDPGAVQRPQGTAMGPFELGEEDALSILASGEIIGGSRIPWSSNYTFLVHVDVGQGKYLKAVYKPRDGERPLYDFPSGSLYKREFAAYLVSRSLGWPPVPATQVRDGPYGAGSIQLYVDADPAITFFDLIDGHAEELMRFAVFDLLTNNADRKGGHCLLGSDGRIWSIDHGLTFHHQFKLRTVMLEFWGLPIPGALLSDVGALARRLDADADPIGGLEGLLDGQEMQALARRAKAILDDPVMPKLDPHFNVPWPLE